MNLWLANIFRDIYGFVNCRDLSDKLGCIRRGILLLRLVLSVISLSRNVFNQLNSSILLNNLRLILLLLTWWSLTMRKSDVEYAVDLVVALHSRFIIYDTAFEAVDHRLQRSADVLTIGELLILRFFRENCLFDFFCRLQSIFHILNRSMDRTLNHRLGFRLNYMSIIFRNIDCFGHILFNRLGSRSVRGDILCGVHGNVCCNIVLNLYLLNCFLSYIRLRSSDVGEILKSLILCYVGANSTF